MWVLWVTARWDRVERLAGRALQPSSRSHVIWMGRKNCKCHINVYLPFFPQKKSTAKIIGPAWVVMEIIAPAGRKIELQNTCASESINNGFSETFKKWSSHNITNEFFRGEIRLIAHPCLSASACASMCLHEVTAFSFFFLLITKLWLFILIMTILKSRLNKNKWIICNYSVISMMAMYTKLMYPP